MKSASLRICVLAGLTILLPACFATRADLNILLDQQKELAMRLSRMQDHLADLTLRVQELRTDVREVRGEMTQVDLAQKPLQKELGTLKERLAQVEQQDRVTERLQLYTNERSEADRLSLTTPAAMFAAAASSYASGETDRALALYGELQRKWPNDAYVVGAKVKRGAIYAEQAMYVETIDLLLEVIEKYPRSAWAPEAYLVLGTTLIEIDQAATGEQLLDDLKQFYPQSAEASVADQWRQERRARLAAEAAAAAPTAATNITGATELTDTTPISDVEQAVPLTYPTAATH